jgi:microcin C transport system substrate-binding protein
MEIKFEILLVSPAFERIVAPFIKNLNKLGIKARIRIVDTAQYKNRLDNYVFKKATKY